MKKRELIVFIICLTTFYGFVFGQKNNYKKNTVNVSNKEGFAKFSVLEDNKKKIKANVLFNYCWYYKNEIHTTKGGFSGKLLHGEFVSYYNNNSLKQQGTFNYGLKNGQWKEWYNDGQLKFLEKWEKGNLNGECTYYDSLDYNKTQIIEYKNGIKHGVDICKSNDTIISKKKYRKGIEIVKSKKQKTIKEKKTKEKKQKVIKSEEPNSNKKNKDKDVLNKTDKKCFFKRIFKSKNNNDDSNNSNNVINKKNKDKDVLNKTDKKCFIKRMFKSKKNNNDSNKSKSIINKKDKDASSKKDVLRKSKKIDKVDNNKNGDKTKKS
ncbi:MAG: hypothetical protein A2X12_05490 [Bacteroidetes bacterium GWE2_29_8]|nr:MAG: hypothetical protein A2X12_05490 [Bacteroidetes bacterium GWE2_29_8]